MCLLNRKKTLHLSLLICIYVYMALRGSCWPGSRSRSRIPATRCGAEPEAPARPAMSGTHRGMRQPQTSTGLSLSLSLSLSLYLSLSLSDIKHTLAYVHIGAWRPLSPDGVSRLVPWALTSCEAALCCRARAKRRAGRGSKTAPGRAAFPASGVWLGRRGPGRRALVAARAPPPASPLR